ncbi:MAG: hypothetical protein GYA36_19395 [Veillonellaceae bacterium]|nr:hypothetical protein [Veillonellaceae bacterium]
MSNDPGKGTLTIEQAVELASSHVHSLDDAEKAAGEKVLAYVAGQLVETGAARVKASQGKYRLEIWLLPAPPRRIFRPMRTILWMAGETTGPGGDQLITECPNEGCNFIFLPGALSKVMTNPRTKLQEPFYLCEKCKQWIPRSYRRDNRICVGTWDILAKHVVFRFRQLDCNAGLLKRILHEDPVDHLGAMLAKEHGATQKYLQAQAHRDGVYYLWEDLMKATASGTDLEAHFKAFLKA